MEAKAQYRANMDFTKIKEEATGKWVDICRQLGIKIREDGKHGPCPMCGGTDRFRFDDKQGRGTYYCNQCGPGDGVKLVQQVVGIDFKEAMETWYGGDNAPNLSGYGDGRQG